MSIGKDVRHDSGIGHVTGESIFKDDRPMLKGELHVGIVCSPVATGKLKKINFEKALAHPKCATVITYKDLVKNEWGAIFHDQPFLIAENEIISYMAKNSSKQTKN